MSGTSGSINTKKHPELEDKIRYFREEANNMKKWSTKFEKDK